MMSLFLALTVSSAAFAQSQSDADLVREAYRVAQNIKDETRYLSEEQKEQVRERLASIRDILSGGGDTGVGSLACVSRDNDGQNPWVLGLKNGVSVRRISGTTSNTRQGCEQMLQSIRTVSGRTLLCVARDNDGQNPWLMAALNSQGELTKVARSSMRSQADCQALINGLRPIRGLVTFCASRDQDGQAPYVAISMDLRSMQIEVGTESFRTVGECTQFVNN